MLRVVSCVRMGSGLLALLLLCVWLGGCASQKEISVLQRQIWAARRELDKNKAHVAELEKALEAYDAGNQPLRRNQAAVGAQLDRMEVELGRLNGLLEESKAMNERNGERIGEVQQRQMESMLEVGKRVDDLERRLALMASYLGLQELAVSTTSNVGANVGAKQKTTVAMPTAAKVQTAKKESITDKEGLYNKAFQLFRGRQFDAARIEFSKYLELYPDSELADNSQFWLGECYYAEKDYRQAIAAYEKTIKRYPKSDKVSSAMLKQGMAFMELGDKTAGKILLKKVVKTYPDSNQAKIAQSKLARIK